MGIGIAREPAEPHGIVALMKLESYRRRAAAPKNENPTAQPAGAN